MISTPDPYLVDTVFTGQNQHTSGYTAEITDNLIIKYGPQNFLVCITDNAANMLAASNLLTKKYPHMYFYGCIAHMLNLIAGDIMNTHNGTELLDRAKHSVKLINNTQVLSSLFKETAKAKNINTSLKMPVVTRWGSTKDCFESVQKCRSALKSIAISEEAEDLVKRMTKKKKDDFMKLKSIALSDTFWEEIESFLSILKPLQTWVLRLERDLPSTIELSCKAFKDIHSELKNFANSPVLSLQERETLISKFEGRKNCYLKDIHFAADLLRPQSIGSNLSANEVIEAMKCIEKIAIDLGFEKNTVSRELAQYLNREAIFSDLYIWQKTEVYSSISWWRTFGKSFSSLSTTAIRILSMPATSASTEKSFKTQSLIHTKKRNRLDNDRVMKLTFIQHNLKFTRRKTEQDYGNTTRKFHLLVMKNKLMVTAPIVVMRRKMN